MKNKVVLKMCFIAIMASLSAILELYLRIDLGYAKITLYALPLLITGLTFGPIIGALCGLTSGFISQIVTYGLSPTTPIWLLAPVAWGLISGLLGKIKRLNNLSLLNLGIIIATTSIIVTSINTLATWLDGIILGYDVRVIFTQVIIRVGISLVVAVFYTVTSYYVIRSIKPLLY